MHTIVKSCARDRERKAEVTLQFACIPLNICLARPSHGAPDTLVLPEPTYTSSHTLTAAKPSRKTQIGTVLLHSTL